MKRLILILLILFPVVVCARTVNVVVVQPAVTAAAPTDFTADANCMGAWFMNGGATETDRSGNGNDLAQTSGTIPTSADVPSGYSGTSRDFESGDTEGLEIDDNTELDINGANQAITVACWVKSETADYTATAHLVGKYNTSDQRQYRLGISSAEKAEFRLSSDGAANSAAVGATNVADGAWHHICGVYNDTDIRIYVDGELDADAVEYSGGLHNSTAQFHIGSYDSSNALYDGLMDEPIVFNRALSADEVADLYANGIDGTKGGSDE
jgi:hypothetical protein